MKALFVVSTIVLLGALSSCSKDYECVCYEGTEQRYRYAITDQTDKGAKEQCEQKQNTLAPGLKCGIE